MPLLALAANPRRQTMTPVTEEAQFLAGLQVNTPERREAARRAIMMPDTRVIFGRTARTWPVQQQMLPKSIEHWQDVFLSRDLVPELVPCCQVACPSRLSSIRCISHIVSLAIVKSNPLPQVATTTDLLSTLSAGS